MTLLAPSSLYLVWGLFGVAAWWVLIEDQSHDMWFTQNAKSFSPCQKKKQARPDPTRPDRIRPDPTGSDRIRPDPTGDLRWDDTIGAWLQSTHLRPPNFFWVLLRDRYGFYAWDLCGFVGLFAMPDNYPFRHNAAFPQIFAFFMILGQFQQKLVWFP